MAQKECNDFDQLFQGHSWLNTIDFCCIEKNILSQVIWHQVHQVWIRRFDSRAIFLRQCRFQNVLLFPPQSGLKQREFFHLTASHWISCVDKSIIALTLKRKTTWMKPRHSLRNFAALSKVRAIMLFSTQWDAVRWKKNPAASSLLAGGGGGVAHFKHDTSSEK